MTVLEGYAALFGVTDLAGDIIRAGAFRASLARRRGPLPMLVQHERRALAGYWNECREDARGLFVRGEVAAEFAGAAKALRLLQRGIDGLSIGFIPIVARRWGAGRMLEEVELLEVSIVTEPMQPLARLTARDSTSGARPDAKPEATFAGRAPARFTLARGIVRAAA